MFDLLKTKQACEYEIEKDPFNDDAWDVFKICKNTIEYYMYLTDQEKEAIYQEALIRKMAGIK